MHALELLTIALVCAASSVVAGETYTSHNGFAVSGYDVVEYWDLVPAPIGTPQPAAVPGKVSITAEYDGALYAFSSEENRARFLETPSDFLPQYDGHCAYGVAQGGKVPGNPNLWRIVDGRLFLNITETIVGFWEEDIPGNLQKSEGNWKRIEPTPASSMPIPQYEGAAPVE